MRKGRFSAVGALAEAALLKGVVRTPGMASHMGSAFFGNCHAPLLFSKLGGPLIRLLSEESEWVKRIRRRAAAIRLQIQILPTMLANAFAVNFANRLIG